VTALDQLIHTDDVALTLLGIDDAYADLQSGAKFDNRPTWDNGKKFDNRPTWDNWSKK
jgi:hypothetical protein